MKDITERVIERLRKANKCGRYSDATVERILEEVLEEEIKESGCCCAKEEYKEEAEEEKVFTLKEIIDQTPLELDNTYKQVLIIAEDEEGYITSCAGNPASIEDRLAMYLFIKNKLQDIMLEGIPATLVKIYERLHQK